jgi:periplasmic divalent cation tolerance protein
VLALTDVPRIDLMPDDHGVLIYSTVPTMAVAEAIVGDLLDRRLIACANVLAGMTAHYLWQGKRQADSEVVMLLKTRSSLADSAIIAGKALHPYETPAFLILDIAGGHPPFLDWIMTETARTKPEA